jgi:mannose-6-phosphate isomerase
MIRFQPIYKQALWGGQRFASEFSRRVPEGTIGESWELVDLETCESRVAQGPLEGKSLGEVWRSGAIGGSATGAFPFLLKWIDTREKLSVQVHPDAKSVKKLGKGAPKSEAWFIAEADPTAVLLLGHYPGLDAQTLKLAATGGTIHKWLYEVRPRVGDMFAISAGMLHTLGPGLLVLEVQQPSETTFRLYDWGRLNPDGQPRELHIDEACASVDYAHSGPPKAERDCVSGPGYLMRALRSGVEIAATSLRIFVADSGPAKLLTARGEQVLEYGEVAVAEVADGPVRLATGTCVLLSEPT